MTKTENLNDIEKKVIGQFNKQLQDTAVLAKKLEGAREGAAQAFIAVRGITAEKVFFDFDGMRLTWEEPDTPADPPPVELPTDAPIQ